uniref:DNA ligase n=1 Tax=Anas platyrhynchos TaxID=8839 RepID=A0A8B9ZFD6_ANAPL
MSPVPPSTPPAPSVSPSTLFSTSQYLYQYLPQCPPSVPPPVSSQHPPSTPPVSPSAPPSTPPVPPQCLPVPPQFPQHPPVSSQHAPQCLPVPPQCPPVSSQHVPVPPQLPQYPPAPSQLPQYLPQYPPVPSNPPSSQGPAPPPPPDSPRCPPTPGVPGDEVGPPPAKRCRQAPSDQDRGPPAASRWVTAQWGGGGHPWVLGVPTVPPLPPHTLWCPRSPPPLDPSQYDPARSGYHPLQDACWGHGQRWGGAEFGEGGLKIIETLSNFLRSVLALSPGELLPCLRLCLNRPGAPSEGLELGIGESLLTRALAQATGRQLAQIRSEAQDKGDLGLVAESSRCTQRTVVAPAPLSAAGVLGKLREMATMSGNASANKKIGIIKGLFVACRHSEARYLVRSLSGKLRIGLAEQSVLTALAHAVALTPPGQGWPPAVLDAGQGMAPEARRAWLEEQSRILKQTFCELPDYAAIVPVLLEHGLEKLPQHCGITPGVPLKPMLAQPARGVGELLKRFEEAAFTCEYKYDGERAQIHVLESGAVFIYSRNQENTTAKYPDLVDRIPKVLKPGVRSCILDAEAVAWDRTTRQIQPFQVLMTRKRKDVDAAAIKVQVCLYAFDLLYLNGEPLVRQPLSARRKLLRESFEEVEGEFVFATSADTRSAEEVSEFLDKAIKASCEGLMVKTLEVDATYEIAKRSHKWLKLKKDYLDGLGDTLDLVVIGAYLGKGKRAGIYGGFLLACYDEESEEYQSICKIGTGFTEESLEKHYGFLKEHVLAQPRPYYRWDSGAAPDRWLAAVQVWEVKCGDLSISPVYRAAVGLVSGEKGISLRFPRFLRVREDKKPEEATSSTQVLGRGWGGTGAGMGLCCFSPPYNCFLLPC